MTNEQRYNYLCRYFDRMINELELDEQIIQNNATKQYISRSEYLQKLYEIEIQKKTIEEVSKSVLYLMKTDSTY